jgi:NADPH:quinone reductase-like Zn-dependent oxidoreductase
MKAILYHRYGSPDVLKYEEVARPNPKDSEVLVKVRAAAVNPHDWHSMRGEPYFIRIPLGPRKPKDGRLGLDVAGDVEAVGRNVTRFKPRDAVFGISRGALAEFACTSESELVMKPDNVTFEQAASAPVAALTALQGLRPNGPIQPGQTVLINGAAGGVGTFGVQIAKSFGAEVTGVCSTRNIEMVRSIGADHVIDYTREDFTKGTLRYDRILDTVGNHSLLACSRVLKPKAACISVGAPGGRWMIGAMAEGLTAPLLARFVNRKLGMVLTKSTNADLVVIHELLKTGKAKPVIDRRYPLNEVPAAIRYLEEGHARGKVIITLE